MALIWQRQKSLSTDFLGEVDECYTFHGDAHKNLARKYLGDLQRQHKQFLFFYGEQGIGKTRLAKQTARELARLVNTDSPLVSLFLINCERYGKDPGPTIPNLKRDIAQKVAAADENLSKVLSKCESHNFSSVLSSFLNDRVFLFLFDGIIANFASVASLMDDLVKNNPNVVVFATSSQYLVLTRQKAKISTHSCIGLSHDAAVSLLQEVAGDELEYELREYQDDVVRLCHYNPFLIMRTGQQMNDDIFPYKPKEMKELLQKSVMLATSCENVPEGEDIFKNELALVERFTREMGRNIECVIGQAEQQFTAEDVTKNMKSRTSDGATKKSLLESFSHSGVLTQDKGFFSLSQIFKEFCDEQKVLLNMSRDDVVIEVYKELKKTLDSFMSKKGVHKLLMIHGDEMKQIQDLEKRIPENEPMRFICRGHLIEACCSFLLNIPLDSQAVSQFREQSFAHLFKIREKEQLPSGSAAKESLGALGREFMQLDVDDFRVSKGHGRGRRDQKAGAKEHGISGGCEGFEQRRNQGKHHRADDSKCQYHQRQVEKRGQGNGDRANYQRDFDPGNPKLLSTTFELPNNDKYNRGEGKPKPRGTPVADTRRVEYSRYQGTPCEQITLEKTEVGKDDSVIDRFSLEKPSPFSHFSDFQSLSSVDEDSRCDEKSLADQRRGVEDMSTRLDFRAMYPGPPPQSYYCPPKSERGNIPVESSEPQEDSFHDPSSPRWTPSAPSQQSFHEWPNGTAQGEGWSMDNNPPSCTHWRRTPPE